MSTRPLLHTDELPSFPQRARAAEAFRAKRHREVTDLLGQLYGHLPPCERYAEALRFLSGVVGELQREASREAWALYDAEYFTLPISNIDTALVQGIKLFEHVALKLRSLG